MYITIALFFALKPTRHSIENILMVLFFFYPFIIIGQLWRQAHAKDNKLFYIGRSFEITEDKINGLIEDGTESAVKFEHVIKIKILMNYYLLYITKNQFLYIPKDSFQSETDRVWFEKEIIQQLQSDKFRSF